MSGERRTSTRKTLRLDYSVFHKTGERVPLELPESFQTDSPESSLGTVSGPSSGLDSIKKDCIMEQNRDKAEALRLKIKRCMAENDVDDLYDITEIEDDIKEVRSLMDSYEDVHVTLRRELADQYVVQFPDYDRCRI